MSYTPNTWTTGDTITATKLNNIEQGIANAGGGWDIVIQGVYDDDGDEFTSLTLESGTYSSISSAIQGGQVLTGVLYYEATGPIYTNSLCNYCYISDESIVSCAFLGMAYGSSQPRIWYVLIDSNNDVIPD